MMPIDKSDLAHVIDLDNVTFRWSADAKPTLKIDKLSITQAEHTFIKGPSGCGKSTLLSLLTGINAAESGKVEVLGSDLTLLSSRQ
ncbi:ATP-binding cassette domain-containing protein, partial [Vibrio campbellii]